MKYISALFFAMMFLASCANEPQSEYDKLYADFQADKNPETYQAFMEATVTKVRELEADDKERQKALDLGISASREINNKGQLVGLLNTQIRDYPEDEKNADHLYELAMLLDEANKSVASQTLMQGFVEQYPDHAKAAEVKAKLTDGDQNAEALLQQLGESMFNSEEGQLDRSAARQFVDVCEAYALTHPQDPKSADYLHKAAETARAMRTIPKALSLYDWILNKYPNHPKAGQALFLKAFTYDNNLNDVENARKYYTAFLEKYPEDDFADDTKFLLENLGKSDEEILEALTKKNQK